MKNSVKHPLNYCKRFIFPTPSGGIQRRYIALSVAMMLMLLNGVAADPIKLPGNFDPEVNMPSHETESATFHESRAGAGLMAQLVAHGTEEDLMLAEKVFESVVSCQELREDDPHYGNFRWMLEDDHVEDLNAVEFVLDQLIPMMLRHGARLSPELRQKVMASIALGLGEIQRMDVSVGYTNIAIYDIVNSCLGGQLLGDATVFDRGFQKLMAWAEFTMANGTTFEFNSPTYTKIAIDALHQLGELSNRDEVQVLARTMTARLGLGVALHVHPKTGRWAGPHSRAYHPTVVGEGSPEINGVRRWIDSDVLPAWMAHAFDPVQLPFQIEETAYRKWNMGLTTYLSDSFSLGVASKELGDQSDVVMVHYRQPGQQRPGVLYTRYTTDDKWFGDFYHATDRSKDRNLSDEGNFFGVQSGARAIGMYTTKDFHYKKSAKANLIWTGLEHLDEIWVGDRKIENFPADIAPGETVVVASGDVLMAVRPLTATDLGRDAPIRLIEVQGDLVLEIHNYLGPKKVFWEMEWPGGFYKGKPQCGFYLEVAERSDHADALAFARTVARGTLLDEAQPAVVYMGEEPRSWNASYSRGGETLGIEVDLMEWALVKRWTEDGTLKWPMLESPVARQDDDGAITIGEAVLNCGRSPAWLYAAPEAGVWAAGYVGPVAPLSLRVPDGRVDIEAMGTGMVVWENGKVSIDSAHIAGRPTITGGTLSE